MNRVGDGGRTGSGSGQGSGRPSNGSFDGEYRGIGLELCAERDRRPGNGERLAVAAAPTSVNAVSAAHSGLNARRSLEALIPCVASRPAARRRSAPSGRTDDAVAVRHRSCCCACRAIAAANVGETSSDVWALCERFASGDMGSTNLAGASVATHSVLWSRPTSGIRALAKCFRPAERKRRG